MNTIHSNHVMRPITQVIVYCGHRQNPKFGPYGDNITKRIQMFEDLNPYRIQAGREPWNVKSVPGEELIAALEEEKTDETLLVIPAGQSSNLEAVFSLEQVDYLREKFFGQGGRGYFTCGASYWVSRKRIYNEVCLQNPNKRVLLIKESTFPIFQGISSGPLCPFPGAQYKVGFYSDAVEVRSPERGSCTIYLSGGGSFIPDPEPLDGQRVRVLARYPKDELLKRGAEPKKNIAAIMVSIGKGAAILSMFHPYYSSKDIDVERYEEMFPESACGTNWRQVHTKLSPTDVRMRFVFHQMLEHLEEMRFV